MCNVATGVARMVTTNTPRVVVVATPAPQTLAENKARLQKIVSGAADAKPVVFACGCSIVPSKGAGKRGVKLVRPNKPAIELKGTADFADFVKGAENAGAGLDPDIDAQGIDKFLEVYRAAFALHVEDSSNFPPTVKACSGPSSPGLGQFKYVPVQQTLAEFFDKGGASPPGIECLASSMVNALMCAGLINPTMERKEFETRYTSIPAGTSGRQVGPTSEDGVFIDGSHNPTLRGMDNVNSLIPVRRPFAPLTALTKVFHDFQGTDWARLMGMTKDLVSLELVDLRASGLAEADRYIQRLDESGGVRAPTNSPAGTGIAFYTLQGVLYSDSEHFVTLHGIVSGADGAQTLLCSENDRKAGNPSPAEVKIRKTVLSQLPGGMSLRSPDGKFDVADGQLFARSTSGANAVIGRLLYTVKAVRR
jgi:hypothetical protein